MLSTFLLICLISTLCSIVVFTTGLSILRYLAKKHERRLQKIALEQFEKDLREFFSNNNPDKDKEDK